MIFNRFFRYRRSLKSRIALSVLIMLLPAAVLMFSAYHAIRGNIETLTHIVDAPLDKLLTTKKIQSKVLRTELPFHLYLNRGEAADRESFIRSSVDIDIMFENLIKLKTNTTQELELLTSAYDEWNSAKTLGESLLTLNNIPENNILTAKVDQYGRHLERSASLLDGIVLNLQEDIKNRRFVAQESEWRSIGMLTLVFGLGVMLALFAGLSLGQSVIQPLRRLEKSIKRFGKGEVSVRSNLQSSDELGGLANAFNVLAERYEHIQNELNYLSVHDTLTGLFDRSKLHEEVNMEIERAKRYDRSFSLLFIDINDFKTVNKTYGRLVGDSVLCSVANKISSTVRPTDITSRYGGDEFAVILSETDAVGASETAQRIIDAIENDPLNIGDGKKLTIAINVGFSTYPNDADSDSALFAVTDHSLLEYKIKSRKTPRLGRIIND